MKIFLFGKILCIMPETAPYVASSNAMQIAIGKKIGTPRETERSKGAIKPTASPQGQPQIKPQSKTGICIGQSIEPISGICPVTKGRTHARAKNNAEKIKLYKFRFFFIKY